MTAETKALGRTAALLLLASIARWMWARPEGDAGPGAPSVAMALIDSTRVAVEEGEARARPLREGEVLDVNRAGEVELDRLPGVGPSTARAIVLAREEGGPFGSVDGLLAVRGIGPSTLEKIRPFVRAGAVPGRRRGGAGGGPAARLDVNRADSADLVGLPGIGPALASRILAERRKQLFPSLEDLVRVRGIGPATVERLRPLVRAGRAR